MKLVTLCPKELELSYILAGACAYTYEKIDQKISRQIKKNIGIHEVEQFEFHSDKWFGLSGILGYFKEYLVIAFKGSDSKNDWLKNIKLLHDDKLLSWKNQSSLSGRISGKVHSGFNSTVNSNLYNLKALVRKKYSPEFCKIILTGHSLGGALAILTAAAFSKDDEFSCLKTVYTYGSPRVGNTEFRIKFDASKDIDHYRFEHRYDSVPHLPLARPFNYISSLFEVDFLVPEYEHTGQLRYLMKDQNGNPVVVKELSELPRFLKRMQLYIENITNLSDHIQKEHHIYTYINHIYNLISLKNYQNTPDRKMPPDFFTILFGIRILRETGKFLSKSVYQRPLLTYRDTIDYFIECPPKYPMIVNKRVILRNKYLSDNIEISEIYQVFLDVNNELICNPNDGIVYGRVLLVKMLDEELTELFADKDMIVLE